MAHHNDEEAQHLATLDELEATQEQITSYQGLLKELPEIFERKFHDRLKPHLDRHQQLLEDRAHLLQQVQQTLPAPAEPTMALLSPSLPPTQDDQGLDPGQGNSRFLWILALAALGITIGMKLSRPLVPAPQKPSHSFSLRSLRQPLPKAESSTKSSPSGATAPASRGG